MRLMLKVQEYYTKSKIRKRQNHPNKLNKDELGQYRRENDQQTITKNKLIKRNPTEKFKLNRTKTKRSEFKA